MWKLEQTQQESRICTGPRKLFQSVLAKTWKIAICDTIYLVLKSGETLEKSPHHRCTG
jgi:hypothetical protein